MHVERLYARELLADQAGGVGYLLKDRVFTDEQFTDALRTVARGGMIMDPEVVSKLLARRSSQMPVTRLTDGEREVLALIAEGRSNSAIARRLVISEKAVSKRLYRFKTHRGVSDLGFIRSATPPGSTR
jgi:DNA-binding NarL/FixJ family response regulator